MNDQKRRKQILKGCIVSTIGPSCDTPEMIKSLIDKGLGMARINLSHGSIEEARRRFTMIREVDENLPIMFDLSGPKIRIGVLESSYNLIAGDTFKLQKKEIVGNKELMSVSYKDLIDLASIGDHFFLNDGLIEVQVIKKGTDELTCEVLKGGPLSSRKGINAPNIPIGLYPPTKKDVNDLKKTVDLKPDFYSVSFVRRAEDLMKVRFLIENETGCIYGRDDPELPLIITKVEHQDALKNIDEILKSTDAVMVARGDLGVEIDPTEVPLVQKDLVHECNLHGIPVIVATQMLESMVFSPRPTRAEASDVANAIFDGADSVMLSAETATGKYPLQSVEVMASIIKNLQDKLLPIDYFKKEDNITAEEAIAKSAVLLADTLGAEAIIANTRSGRTARVVSKYRPKQTIIGITNSPQVKRQLNLLWGVVPLFANITYFDTDSMISSGIYKAYKEGLVTKDGLVIVIAGSKLGQPFPTNLIQYYRVKDILDAEEGKRRLRTYQIN